MIRKAHIKDNIIVNISVSNDSDTHTKEDGTLVLPCPDFSVIGSSYISGVFEDTTPPKRLLSLSEAKAKRSQELKEFFKDTINEVDVTESLRETIRLYTLTRLSLIAEAHNKSEALVILKESIQNIDSRKFS